MRQEGLKTVPLDALSRLEGKLIAYHDKTLDFVTKQRDKTLATLKALKSIPPKLEQEFTRAVFDLSQVSIEGGVSLPKMTFRKVEGKWYLTNR